MLSVKFILTINHIFMYICYSCRCCREANPCTTATSSSSGARDQETRLVVVLAREEDQRGGRRRRRRRRPAAAAAADWARVVAADVPGTVRAVRAVPAGARGDPAGRRRPVGVLPGGVALQVRR